MKFQEYWESQGARYYASFQEDRAKHAWDASRLEHKKNLIFIRDMLENRGDTAKATISEIIANLDILTELDRMIHEIDQ